MRFNRHQDRAKATEGDGITIALAVVATTIIGLLVKATIGLRIAPDVERQGLDINEHGEEGYMTS